MKNIIKKIVITVFVLATVFGTVKAEENTAIANIQIGDYVQLGKYKDIPIVWRNVDVDENGKLMLSEKTLSPKTYGYMVQPYYDEEFNNCWKYSFIRYWLNSAVSEGEINWGLYIPKMTVKLHGGDEYEKGFLHDSNFSKYEKLVIKSVTQWNMLPSDRIIESENNIDTVFTVVKEYIPGNPRDGGYLELYEIWEYPDIYYGAAHQITDKIFLLDIMQLHNIWENFRDIKAFSYIKEDSNYYGLSFDNGYSSYMLRTPDKLDKLIVDVDGEVSFSGLSPHGIRPAFYLDEEKAVIVSGSGTEEDPYILTGKGEGNDGKAENNNEQSQNVISVFCNGDQVSFDQSPFIENDRVLVPMRAIFEELGATVLWEERTETITATDGYSTIVMQIGNNIIAKNDEGIEAEVAPRIIGDRTFVPLRVISESLGAEVNWDDESHTVTINR